MGVPGDMNLELLDYIDEVDGLTWGKSSPLISRIITAEQLLINGVSEQWVMPTS